MPDQGPKSALDIAMERLRQKDAEQGVKRRPLTEEQKAAIAEVRNFYEARLAQDEVLHKSALAKTHEPEARSTLQDDYTRERQRLISERDKKIERLRNG
jgi:hypothetical protein